MKGAFNKLSNSVSTLFSALFGTAARQSDHRRLTQYIVTLNQKESPEEIISEASMCLKDILNYRLFAFVIKKENGIDVGLDPRMYKKSLESVIIKDFSITNTASINYMNHQFHPDETEWEYSMENLVSYDLMEENCQAKIYMLPNRTMLNYHDEIVNIILKSTGIALSRQMNIARLTDAAALDPLTGCYNRREFESQIQRSVADATRHKKALSVFMLDIDHFKVVNDTYGHPAGDKVLKEVAAIVNQNMRKGDTLSRYGGEEFIAILPETDKHKAMELADRLRQKIAAREVPTDQGVIRVTASFGVAQLHHNTEGSRLIQDADCMLYKAKRNGRNTVMPGLIKICPPKGSDAMIVGNNG
jgi:diguanylate cyclase (GGDEF)-like protein